MSKSIRGSLKHVSLALAVLLLGFGMVRAAPPADDTEFYISITGDVKSVEPNPFKVVGDKKGLSFSQAGDVTLELGGVLDGLWHISPHLGNVSLDPFTSTWGDSAFTGTSLGLFFNWEKADTTWRETFRLQIFLDVGRQKEGPGCYYDEKARVYSWHLEWQLQQRGKHQRWVVVHSDSVVAQFLEQEQEYVEVPVTVDMYRVGEPSSCG